MRLGSAFLLALLALALLPNCTRSGFYNAGEDATGTATRDRGASDASILDLGRSDAVIADSPALDQGLLDQPASDAGPATDSRSLEDRPLDASAVQDTLASQDASSRPDAVFISDAAPEDQLVPDANIADSSIADAQLDPLAAPTTPRPADSWPAATSSPALAWSAGTISASIFELVISGSPDCSGSVVHVADLTSPGYTVPANAGLSMGSTYYWCVRASDGLHPDSDWSGPWRLPLRGLRLRARLTQPLPQAYGSAAVTLPDPASGQLILPASGAGYDFQVLGYRWSLDPHTERWALQLDGATSGASPTLTHLLDLAWDPVRENWIVIDQPNYYGAAGAPPRGNISTQFSLHRYKAAGGVWQDLPYVPTPDALDAGSADAADAGEPKAYLSSASIAYDISSDQLLIMLTNGVGPGKTVQALRLDLGGSPAALQAVNTSNTPVLSESTQLFALDDQGLFAHLAHDENWLPRFYLYDGAAETWSGPQERALGTRIFRSPQGEIFALAPASPASATLFHWSNAQRWEADALVSSTLFHSPLARNGIWLDERSAFVSAAPLSGSSQAGGNYGALILEPDAWPVLTLLSPDSGSSDGTTTTTVHVRISGDDEAVAWLLTSDLSRPADSDPRFVTTRPSRVLLDATPGLKRLSLWLRYAHGRVGPVPAQASIWYLPDPPVAPRITVWGYSPAGELIPNETYSKSALVLLRAPFNGIASFLIDLATDPPPTYSNGLSPMTFLYGIKAAGDVTIHAWVVDVNGQRSAMSQVQIFSHDTRPPIMRFDVSTNFAMVSTADPTLRWSSTDLSLPVTADLRVSTGSGDCSGDVVNVDGITDDFYALNTRDLVPGTIYTLCLRGSDSWSPANTSDWVQTQIWYHATPARWSPLASLPTKIVYTSGVAYDSSRDRILLFGGFSNDYKADVYAYDSAADSWQGPLAVSGSTPHGRGNAVVAYDATRDRLLVTGGFYNAGNGSQYSQDTWALDLASMRWSQLSPTGDIPMRSGATSYIDASENRWIVGRFTMWTGEQDYNPRVLDLLTDAWSTVPAYEGYTDGTGNLIAFAGQSALTEISFAAIYDLDLTTLTSTRRVEASGFAYLYSQASAFDDASGLIVQYPINKWAEVSQTAITHVLDPVTGLRFLSDAANITDRGYAGVIRDSSRRSVVMIGGATQHGDPWVNTNQVLEFRFNGGPRVFASDPTSKSETEVSGDTVSLAIDWDEGASEWLVNEVAWPPPDFSNLDWQVARPDSYSFFDNTPGDKTIYVWIQDSAGVVIKDAGRATIFRYF